MTTLTTPGRLMRPVATPPARRAVFIGFGATLLAGLLVLVGMSASIGITAAGTVLPGVSVGGVPLGGLSRQDAAARLEAELPSLTTGSATVVVGTETRLVPYAAIGRGYEIDAMIDAAFGVARGGNPLVDGLDRLRNLANPAALPVIVHAYDRDALEQVAADLAAQFTTEAVDAVVVREGSAFTVTPSQAGVEVDHAAIEAALAAAVDTSDPADVTIELDAAVVEPNVSTALAEEVADAARATVASLALEIPNAADGEEPVMLAPETIASWISLGPKDDVPYAIHFKEARIDEWLATLAETVNQDAINARIGVAAGGGLGGVIAGQDGRELDVEGTKRALLAALEGRQAGRGVASAALAVNVTEPAFSTAEAQAVLPRMEMISSWTTYYVPGEGNGWGNNINIPARDIDGRNLAPGEWFSFWGSVGPITEERGFTYGGAIINGRSTQGVAIGGGICSTSTTIFNAALRAGLEMGDRLNHYYYIDRYPDGLDATVSIMDGWTQDMTFRNDTDNPIVIRGFGGNGSVTFQVWSVPLNRNVVITDPVTSNHRRASDTTVVDPSMAPGTSRRVEYPHDGHDVSRTRFVYDANGNLIHRNDYFSHYATVTGIVAVGPSTTAAAEPEPESAPVQEEPAAEGGVATTP